MTHHALQLCSRTQTQSLISLTRGQVRLLKPAINHTHTLHSSGGLRGGAGGATAPPRASLVEKAR